MSQVNPPFDASAPCPMCQTYVRGLSAILHNAYNRFGQGKFFVKVADLCADYQPETALTVPHPATEAMLALVKDVVEICSNGGLTQEGLSVRWTPECAAKLNALYDRWCKVCADLDPLSEAHFDDQRHAGGQDNLLRAQQGCKFSGYGTYKLPEPRDYHYTVEIVAAGGDLTHQTCGAHLKLHDHFKERIARDPNFYARIWCPGCRSTCPSSQFQS